MRRQIGVKEGTRERERERVEGRKKEGRAEMRKR